MTKFDPDAFMQETVDQPLAVDRTLCPEGEYRFTIDDFTSDAFQSIEFEYKRGPNAGQPGEMVKFGCPCILQDEKVAQDLGMTKVIVYKNCTLDFDNATGKLAWGPNRNVDLGQLRNAVGQNAENTTWAPGNLRGAGPFMGRVEHRSGKRKDGSPFKIAEITRCAPIR